MSVQLQGEHRCELEPCQISSATASEIDPAVNLYRLLIDSDCLALDTLISLDNLEVEGDVLNILGDNSETGIALELYRI